MSTRNERSSKSQNQRHAAVFRELLKKPSNKKCADCGRNDPRWASWNLGVFICIGCSGVHRSMGTHISKVKSIDLDTWTPEQVENMKRWGNYKANKYWEANLKDKSRFTETNDRFIRAKYDLKSFVSGNDVPNPDTIPDEGETAVITNSSKQSVKPMLVTEDIQGIFSGSKPTNTNTDELISIENNKSNSNNNSNNSNNNKNNILLFSTLKNEERNPSSTNSLQLNNNNNNNQKPKNQVDSLKSSILSLYNQSPKNNTLNNNNNYSNFSSYSFPNINQNNNQSQGMNFNSTGNSNHSSYATTSNHPNNNINNQNGFSSFNATPNNNNGFASYNNNNGYSSYNNNNNNNKFNSAQTTPAIPQSSTHDPFDFVSLSSFSKNNSSKNMDATIPSTTKKTSTNDEFSDFQTASFNNNNWANF